MADAGYYTRSLRVIGQEVSKLHPALLEIELTGDMFLIRGTCAAEAQDSLFDGEWNINHWLKQSEQNPHKDLGQPSLKRFELRYSPQDIDKLDAQWARRRGSVNKKPELWSFPRIWSLSELLRTVGRYIDSEEGGRLLKITRENDRVLLQIQDKQGNVKALECSLIELCRIQARMVSKRGAFEFKHMKAIWEQYDLKV
jgi:hypothetical protein